MTKKLTLSFILLLLLGVGCKKEKIVIPQDELETQKTKLNSFSNISNTTPSSLLRGGSIDIFPTSTPGEYYTQVTFSYIGQLSTQVLISIGGKQVSTTVHDGPNIVSVTLDGLSHGTELTAEAQFQSTGPKITLAKATLYLPPYESNLKLQALPEFLDYNVSYSIQDPYGISRHYASFNFSWPSEYRDETKRYSFSVLVGTSLSNGVIVGNEHYNLIRFEGSATPSQGAISLGGLLPSYFNMPYNMNFYYQIAITEDGGDITQYFSGNQFQNPPRYHNGYISHGPVKVLKKTSGSLVYY